MQYYVGGGGIDRRQCEFLPDDVLCAIWLGTAGKLL
jgi:hypothetical protein